MIKYELVGYNSNINLNTISYPLYFYMELNENCNFNCKFCSVNKKINKHMKLEQAKQILDKMKKINVYDVYYTGGEPLLYPYFREIVEYATSLGFRQTILTNGYLIDKYKDLLDKLMCVCISLHGSKDIHNDLVGIDCYERVIKNILLAKEYTNVKINYTVTKDNQSIKEMEEVLKFAQKNDIGLSFAKYNNVGEGKSNNCSIDLREFVKNLDILKNMNYIFSLNDCITPCLMDKKYEYLAQGCGAGYIFCSFDVDGNAKICPSSSRVLGNINKTSFKKIWNQPSLRKFREFDWIPVYCKSCKNLSRCRCGCKVESSNELNLFNDYQVNCFKEQVWNEIKDKQFRVNIGILRKDKDFYVSLSNPPRKFNEEAIKVVELINNGENPKNLEYAKDLILSLYRDEILKEVK